MKLRVWHPSMTEKETADLAYWERNMLALFFSDGWYYDDVENIASGYDWSMIPRYVGWRRVLSICQGKMTFHIPDDFEVGHLPKIAPNWDGHTTEEKWKFVARKCGANLEP